MNENASIPLRKMNGLGNDFAVLDARPRTLLLSVGQARAIADRDAGIGCDQVIAIEPSPAGADAFMRIWNHDGGEVEACGNAMRCVASVLAEELGRPNVSIQTSADMLSAVVNPDGTVTVDMGAPKILWNEIPLAEEFHDTRTIELQVGPIDDPVLHSPSVVNVGNPHCIFWVDDLDAHALDRIGPVLEHHPLFPRARQYYTSSGDRAGCHHRSRVGTGRRPYPCLWHSGLCSCSCGGTQGARRPQNNGNASRWSAPDGVA